MESPGYRVGRYLISSEILDLMRVQSREVEMRDRKQVRWFWAYCKKQ